MDEFDDLRLTPRPFPDFRVAYSPFPKVGDTVHVDYGSSALARPEFAGVVEAVLNGELIVSGRVINLSYVAHVHVVEERRRKT